MLLPRGSHSREPDAMWEGSQPRTQSWRILLSIFPQFSVRVRLKPMKSARIPGRSQHDALDALSYALLKKKVNYVLDADIRGFFDNLDKSWMIKFVEHRVEPGHKLGK